MKNISHYRLTVNVHKLIKNDHFIHKNVGYFFVQI